MIERLNDVRCVGVTHWVGGVGVESVQLLSEPAEYLRDEECEQIVSWRRLVVVLTSNGIVGRTLETAGGKGETDVARELLLAPNEQTGSGRYPSGLHWRR